MKALVADNLNSQQLARFFELFYALDSAYQSEVIITPQREQILYYFTVTIKPINEAIFFYFQEYVFGTKGCDLMKELARLFKKIEIEDQPRIEVSHVD